MGGHDEMRTRGQARTIAQHIACRIDADIPQTKIGEAISQECGAIRLEKRRRRGFTKANLIGQGLRLGGSGQRQRPADLGVPGKVRHFRRLLRGGRPIAQERQESDDHRNP